MVAYGAAIRTGLRIAGRIDKKYNINKIFIEKHVPPQWRRPAGLAFDVAGLVGTGIAIYSYLTENSNNGILAPQVYEPYATYKQYKTRHRPTRRYRKQCYPAFRFSKSRRQSRY